MDAGKLLTDAVTELILTQSFGNVAAVVNDVTEFLNGVQKFSRDVENKELLAHLCKEDMSETVKSALSYVDSIDHLYCSEQSISVMAKIQNGLKSNDSKPLTMFLSFQDRHFQKVGGAYRRLIEDCKRTRDTLGRAANECRRRQDDAC